MELQSTILQLSRLKFNSQAKLNFQFYCEAAWKGALQVMLQLDSGSQSCFRLQNDFTDIPSVVLVTARGVLLPGHVHIACLCLLAADVAAGEECPKDREMAKGGAVSSWLLNTEQCPYLSKSRKNLLNPYIYRENITDSILNKERWDTNLGIGGECVKWGSDILSPAATRCGDTLEGSTQ